MKKAASSMARDHVCVVFFLKYVKTNLFTNPGWFLHNSGEHSLISHRITSLDVCRIIKLLVSRSCKVGV